MQDWKMRNQIGTYNNARVKRCIDRLRQPVVASSYEQWATASKRTLRLRADSQSKSKAYITIAIRLWYDYDKTTTKNWHLHFLLASNRVEWKQVRAIRRSRIIVVSQSNRTHIVISITSVVVECVVVSSYRRRKQHQLQRAA